MEKRTELETMFPEEVVPIKIGEHKVDVVVTPLSLEDLPKVIQAFGKLMKYAESGLGSPAELTAKGLEELILLVPYCISIPAKYVPSTEVPALLEVVVKQNITEEVVGKWKSLVQTLTENFGEKANLDETLKKLKKT